MPAGALERAVELLRRLSETGPELTVAELAADAGMPTSTAYRLLAELEQYGLVQRSSDRTVALGTRLVALGRTAEAGLHERLVQPAEAVMARLSERTGETALLTAPCGHEGIVLHVVEGLRHSVRLSYALLQRAPMHRGASGKVMAAYLEESERARLLQDAGDPGLERELERIRGDGFVVTRGELDEGAGAVAAPILDRRERLVAGLSLAGPQERIVAALPDLVGDVREAAAEICRAYDGDAPPRP
jgi:IclR family transcriptional regulator, acetate operon repressor